MAVRKLGRSPTPGCLNDCLGQSSSTFIPARHQRLVHRTTKRTSGSSQRYLATVSEECYTVIAPRDASAARQNDIVAQNDAVVARIGDFVVPRVGTRCPGGRHQRAKRRFRRSRQRGRRPDSRCRSAKPRTRLFGRRWRGSLQGRWCFAPWRRCAERQGSAAAACRQVRTWLVLG